MCGMRWAVGRRVRQVSSARWGRQSLLAGEGPWPGVRVGSGASRAGLTSLSGDALPPGGGSERGGPRGRPAPLPPSRGPAAASPCRTRCSPRRRQASLSASPKPPPPRNPPTSGLALPLHDSGPGIRNLFKHCPFNLPVSILPSAIRPHGIIPGIARVSVSHLPDTASPKKYLSALHTIVSQPREAEPWLCARPGRVRVGKEGVSAALKEEAS